MPENEDLIWDDGEWVSWEDISNQIQYKEWRVKYPDADLSLVPIFESLLSIAEEYHQLTNKHLQVFGDIGELFGAISLGLKLHRNYAQGSDARLGNDFVEVKTITPFKKYDTVEINLAGNFNKLLIVKINRDYEVSSLFVDRKNLPGKGSRKLRLQWDQLKSMV
tara:strand:+ start:80 stop:571 length:492 start_codon:yes stop_codon:yes gene_type:complete